MNIKTKNRNQNIRNRINDLLPFMAAGRPQVYTYVCIRLSKALAALRVWGTGGARCRVCKP